MSIQPGRPPMKQINHPAHGVPTATEHYDGDVSKLRDAMESSKSDGQYNYTDSMYNAQMADPIARP